MAKDRTGKFWWEYNSPHYITLKSMRGLYDPALTSDCRCGKECENCEFGNYCVLRPWLALCSVESWGEGILTSDGLPDGDMPNPDNVMIPFEDRIACDIFGKPYYLYDDLEEDEQEDIDQFNWSAFPDVEEQVIEPELDISMNEALIIVLPFEKTDGYDHLLDNLPTRLSNSHAIVGGRKRNSNKDIRIMSKNGSYSHGWRGKDQYKNKRRRTDRKIWSHI